MPQKLPWSPWHRVVKLREDVRTGELSLADFAADLHDVMMQRGVRPIYEDPVRFFALTYPTFALRELARDVVLRLAGRNTKAVRQLELTYGGGKTHTLWPGCASASTSAGTTCSNSSKGSRRTRCARTCWRRGRKRPAAECRRRFGRRGRSS